MTFLRPCWRGAKGEGTLTPTYAHEEMKVYRGGKVESRKFAER